MKDKMKYLIIGIILGVIIGFLLFYSLTTFRIIQPFRLFGDGNFSRGQING
jgi:hypothetical protein